jgi:hypothetical protein
MIAETANLTAGLEDVKQAPVANFNPVPVIKVTGRT